MKTIEGIKKKIVTDEEARPAAVQIYYEEFNDIGSFQKAKRFLDFSHFSMSQKPIADRATSLRCEHRWKLPDALRLATRNTRDFSPEAHDFVSVPYTF